MPQPHEKKYEFTGETRREGRATLHRIRARRDLDLTGVKAGDLGGWLARESNLSHDGECWVYPDAMILGQAKVTGHACLLDRAVVRDHARVRDALLYHDAQVQDRASLVGGSITEMTVLYGHAKVRLGEDGPQLLPGIEIDFDVHYGLDYAAFGFSYGGYLLAVSQSGRVCLAGNWNAARWAGSLEEFRVHIGNTDDAELQQALKFAQAYLGRL